MLILSKEGLGNYKEIMKMPLHIINKLVNKVQENKESEIKSKIEYDSSILKIMLKNGGHCPLMGMFK